MNTYINPTSFVTYIPTKRNKTTLYTNGKAWPLEAYLPLSCVAGPALTQGNSPGQRYEYCCNLRPMKSHPQKEKGLELP